MTVVDNTIWLRLVKKGSAYTAYFSVDGKKFEQAGKVDIVLKDINAGLIACDGVLSARFAAFMRPGMAAPAKSEPIKASFDWFRIAQ